MQIRLILFAVLAFSSLAFAQFGDRPVDRLILSGSAAVFRINHDDFSRIYDSRSGLALGAAATLKIRAPYNVVVKYHQFEREHPITIANEVYNLNWRERWVNVGIRYLSYSDAKTTSFFGFGFAFFDVEESGPLTLFREEDGRREANGFFLDVGFDYRFVKRAGFFVEVEITSASVGGGAGFEGSSVGGYLLGAGLNLFLF